MSRQDWRSPPELLRAISEQVLGGRPLGIDVAATEVNSVAPRHYSEAQDGLAQKWDPANGVHYCNPPFAKAGLWAAKCAESLTIGVESVLVCPVGCSQMWWHEHVKGKAVVWYPTRRINFLLPDGTRGSGADRDTVVCHFTHECVPGKLRPLNPETWLCRPLYL